uniref:Uncharacterized protein n=1 Tax=Grammatophora oceanica TaxID=210454 RepID=A0A7S1UU78_9STRA
MREESAFYRDWLKPKFESYCDLRGWKLPPVSAFECELDFESEFLEQQNRTLVTVIDDEEGSANSDVTMDTNSVSSKNPLVNYLREIEAKTEMKKRAKINAAYRRVQEQLKPKKFSQEQNSRLRELKVKKARRRRGSTWSPELASLPKEERSTFSLLGTSPRGARLPRAVTNLHKHGWISQMLVTVSLATTLLLTLNLDLIFGFSDTMASNDHGWGATILLDIATFVHLGLSAIVYFAFCDVAIVYCIDSLDLGMKSGKLSKKHYSENVRLMVGLFSVTLVMLSFLNATCTFASRVGAWYLICAFRYLKTSLAPTLDLLDSYGVIAVTWRYPYKIVGHLLFVAESLVMAVLGLLKTMFVDTNLMGDVNGFLAATVGGASTVSARSVIRKISTSSGAFIEHVLAVYEGDEEVTSWRANAIATTRFTLTYTAVFLFTLLMLFSTSTKKEKDAMEDSFSKLVSTPQRSPETSLRSLAPINEGVQLRLTSDEHSVTDAAASHVQSENASVSEGTRKRRFVSFGKRKTQTTSF